MLTNDSKEVWNERKKQIKYNKRHSFTLSGRKKVIDKYYYMAKGVHVNFDNPRSFSEKIQVRKLSYNPLFILCADKSKVRDYVKDKIGEKYLIEQYFSKRKITITDLEKLPDRFAIKTNNASSTNVIVMDKEKENLSELCDKMNFFTTINYGYLWGEYFYTKIPVRIVAEKLLLDSNGNIPDDFKVHCFNDGKTKHKFFETFYTVDGNLMKNIYDEDWKLLDYQYGFGSDGRNVKRPDNLDEIIDVCDKLSSDFNYVRVDLYICDDKIYFGELTFTPGSGFAKFNPPDADLLWGKYMGIEGVN